MINRLINSDLVELLDFFPAVGIIGPRQVGKTTLAKSIQLKGKPASIYLDMEFPPDIARLADPVLFLESHRDHCIILDEIQRVPELFPTLRAIIDRNRTPGRFILLGSASPELIRDTAESLAGRIAYKELTPFLLTELSADIPVVQHWLTGGFPDAFRTSNTRLRNAWFSNFIQTYVERDIPQLGLRVSPGVLHTFITMLAHFHGNLWNASTLAKSLGVTSPTVQRYLDFLADAFLVRKLPPYFTNIKKRLVKSPKVYLRDTGLLHHLLHITTEQILQGHYMLGHSWEGYVVEQICNSSIEHLKPFFYRTVAGTECDLVLTRSGVPVAAIEIKYTSAPKLTKGFGNAIIDLQTTNNFIVTPSTEEYLLREDVTACSIRQFLSVHLPSIISG